MSSSWHQRRKQATRDTQKETLQHVVTVLDIEDPPEVDDADIDEVLGLSPTLNRTLRDQGDQANTPEIDEAEDQLLHKMRHQQTDSDTIHVVVPDKLSQPRSLLTLEATPDPRLSSISIMPGQFEDEDDDEESDQNTALPQGWRSLGPDQEIPDLRENNAP
ncbi:hypothetical protein EK21DRAFT_94930 [Setomelanomma holmii]|uniref:Uncharacterized protein n=1 Tax=Setomelanomma holmii TaxID=210430 RepID=A0A9P4GWT0_9PLEO|nr:hypothetical protein EK21DRAFT_94930 [Setomelanomma holmii]